MFVKVVTSAAKRLGSTAKCVSFIHRVKLMCYTLFLYMFGRCCAFSLHFFPFALLLSTVLLSLAFLTLLTINSYSPSFLCIPSSFLSLSLFSSFYFSSLSFSSLSFSSLSFSSLSFSSLFFLLSLSLLSLFLFFLFFLSPFFFSFFLPLLALGYWGVLMSFYFLLLLVWGRVAPRRTL